ncbi:MAG: DNA repair protein RecN [Bacteroidaceae bacterium]|nr:DNA repair protein RecN [Bacteroidaceae bacterium]MBR1789434.1 DNA repair protein RecN [Bacteroidaceae bacterium]
MITSLHIQNYALIEQLDIEFGSGFSVITGETGAGKSILLGAIGLLLGQRADLRMIKAGAQRCIIEARFDLSQYDFADYFSAHDLDFDGEECIIRRELTATGKSRAFINDTPTSLTDLKELGDQLIDIHSQHQNLLLNREGFQLNVLDAVAKDQTLLAEYRTTYKAYVQAKDALRREQEEYERGKEELDYIAFQHQQLAEAELSEDEEEALEQELNTLEHAEEIKSALYQSYSQLDGEEAGAVSLIRDASRRVEAIAGVYSPAQELAERLESCYIELRDVANELSSGAEQVEYDPERLTFVNERISQLHALKQKFHKESVAELIALREDLGQQLSRIQHSDTRIHDLEKEIDKISQQLDTKANKLTSIRTKAAKVVEKEMQSRLVPLGMPNVRFQVGLAAEESFTVHGRDKVSFLFSANKNVPLQPISQVASGGEISRLMLSLKALISGVEKLPTIIFDEIDTGVSGHIAEQMAKIMKEMGDGQHRQVICITHLPQIAAMGSRHYRVYKTDESDSTTSHIVSLSTEERVEELARMLSGSTLTQAAIDNARALLGIA